MRVISCKNYSPPSLRGKSFNRPRQPVSLMRFSRSHEHIREMEHELFQSRLKPFVHAALLSKMIRSTSSGENPHRAAAMDLVFERSIQERRERVSTKVKNKVQRDHTPRPERSSNAPDISIPQVESPLPPPQPPSQLFLDSNTDFPSLSSPSIKKEAPLDPPTPSKPGRKSKKAVRREEPPADAKINPPPSEGVVELACRSCGSRQLRSQLRSGIYCSFCFGPTAVMKCVNCGTIRINLADACDDCCGKFE